MKKIYFLDCVKILYRTAPAAAAAILILRVLTAFVPAANTLLVAGFVDGVVGMRAGQDEGTLVPVIVCMAALVAYSWVSKSAVSLLEQRMEMRVRADFKPCLIEKISRLKYEYMENSDMRDKIFRVDKEVTARVGEAYMSLLKLLELFLKVLGILAVMFTQVWWVAVLILVVSVPCFFIAIRSGKEGYDAEAEVSKEARIYEYYGEMLKNREFVDERTLFGYSGEYRKRFEKQYETVRKHKTKVRLYWTLKMKAGGMATILVSVALILSLVPLTLGGKLGLGMFMALMNAVFGIVQNMSWDLAWAIDRSAWFNEYFKEMREVFALKEDETAGRRIEKQEEPDTKKFDSLEFRDVSFRYPGAEDYVLRHVSFVIKAGKKYAFVGANGAGKTTIIKLVSGLYQDYEGKILVNGRDLKEHGTQFMAAVFQDYARYPLSLKDNIAIIKNGRVSEGEIRKVIEDVELEDVAARLKDGIDTGLGKYGEDSQDLSGGEWQKVAMARCLLSDAPLKILDEPTAAMDPVYETMIYQKFRQISQDKTVMLISHRLSSVKMSDIIFVLDSGRIAEEGSHRQLMERKGLYQAMYAEQSKWYEKTDKEELCYGQ